MKVSLLSAALLGMSHATLLQQTFARFDTSVLDELYSNTNLKSRSLEPSTTSTSTDSNTIRRYSSLTYEQPIFRPPPPTEPPVEEEPTLDPEPLPVRTRMPISRSTLSRDYTRTSTTSTTQPTRTTSSYSYNPDI